MPCSDYSDRDYRDDKLLEVEGNWIQTKNRLDEVTRMLCGVIQWLRENTPIHVELLFRHVDGLRGWTEDHDEQDRLRAEAEAKADRERAVRDEATRKLADFLRTLPEDERESLRLK